MAALGRIAMYTGVIGAAVARGRHLDRQEGGRPSPWRSPTPGQPPPPGHDAAGPLQIPARGWKQILLRAFAEGTKDNVSMLAGGVAFFGFLAIFPALIALISVYGLVADPAEASATVQSVTAGLPSSVQPLIADQLGSITSGSTGGLTTGLIVSALAALFSASSGVQNLMSAVNIAYDETETRGAVKLRALALALTLGAVVFLVVAIVLVAVAPVLLDQLGPAGRLLAQVVRWVLLVLLVVFGLAAVYRVAPDRKAPQFRWVTLGSALATVLWIAGSVLFSVYVNNFGSYNKTYGALAGVIVLLLWLYLTSYIVLLGAEINSESEYQTTQDTTRGVPHQMGVRGATKADDSAGRGVTAAPVRAS